MTVLTVAHIRRAPSMEDHLVNSTQPLAFAAVLLMGVAVAGIACRASFDPIHLGYQLRDEASYVVSLEQKMAVRMGDHAMDGSRTLRAGYSIRAAGASIGEDLAAIVHLDSVRVDLVMGQSRHLIDTRHLPGREFAFRLPAAGGPPQYDGDEVPTVEMGERGGGSVPTSLLVDYAFPSLPDEPVAVGSTWTERTTRRQLEASVWVTADVTTTHTAIGYDTVEGTRCLVIESASSGTTKDGSARGATFAYAGDVRGSARWCFDAASGALLSMSGEEVTAGVVNPDEGSASIDQTSSITIRHVAAEVTSSREGR